MEIKILAIKKNRTKTLFISALLLCSSFSGALTRAADTAESTSEWRDVRKRLEKAVSSSRLSRESLSLVVGLKRKGRLEEVWSLAPEKKRVPASLTKVFTAAAVVNHFSPSYQFVTRLFASQKSQNGVLNGGLYLKGGGDPSFVSEKLWFLVNEFHRQGIRKINGGIIVDDSLFDRELFPSRGDKRVDRAYDAPIGAMSFNWNSVNVFVSGGATRGAAVKVFVDPENGYIQLKNSAKTGRKKNLKVQRKRQKKGRDLVLVKGTLPVGHPEKAIYKSISYPSLWSGENLKSFLERRGIQVSGGVRRGTLPPRPLLLAESKSKPLSMIIADLMKYSNNYVAEMLTKQMSLKKHDVGNLSGGMTEIRNFMRSLGFRTREFALENSSGLTQKNLATAKQVMIALDFMRTRFDLGPEFIASLPIAGVDGTLKSRMKNSIAERWVRAKTGLLSGVVGLGGYAGRKDGIVFTFAFIYNGKSGGEYEARRLFDQLATKLVE